MPEPPSPETLSWLRHAASCGHRDAQLTLHILERLDALEAAHREAAMDELREASADLQPTPEAAPVATDAELLTDGDSSQRQWYSYDPEEGIEIYSSREQAKSAAQSIMGSYQVAAHSDGWHEDMESVSWGMLIPVEHAQIVARGFNEPGEEIEEWVRYELKASQPAPPIAPAGGLVERVADAIVTKATSAGIVDDRPARAAIREVAAWLRENEFGYHAAHALEQEAGR